MHMKKLIRVKGSFVYSLFASVKYYSFGAKTVYGISIGGEGNYAIAENISESFRAASELFELIVEEELYPEHLMDVVEDYIAEHTPHILQLCRVENEPPHIA